MIPLIRVRVSYQSCNSAFLPAHLVREKSSPMRERSCTDRQSSPDTGLCALASRFSCLPHDRPDYSASTALRSRPSFIPSLRQVWI